MQRPAGGAKASGQSGQGSKGAKRKAVVSAAEETAKQQRSDALNATFEAILAKTPADQRGDEANINHHDSFIPGAARWAEAWIQVHGIEAKQQAASRSIDPKPLLDGIDKKTNDLFMEGYRKWFASPASKTMDARGGSNVNFKSYLIGVHLNQHVHRALTQWRASKTLADEEAKKRKAAAVFLQDQQQQRARPGPSQPSVDLALAPSFPPTPPMRGPMPEQSLADAGLAFLKAPSEWLKFEAGERTRDNIIRAFEYDHTLRINRKAIQRAPMSLPPQRDDPGYNQQEFDAFLEECGLVYLAPPSAILPDGNVQRVRRTLHYSTKNSDGTFARTDHALFSFVARGTFNQIWQVDKPNEGEVLDPAVLARFPAVLRPFVEKQNIVLRLPVPEAPELSQNAAISELENIADTALAGYGLFAPLVGAQPTLYDNESAAPPLYTTEAGANAGATSAVSAASAEGHGKIVRYKLVMFLQKATMGAHERLFKMTPIPRILTGHLKDAATQYFKGLRAVVWGMSAQRCVHLDLKPSNIVDTYPRSEEMGGDVLPVDFRNKGGVRVIDLDAGAFRRMTRAEVRDDGQHRAARGWRPLWLHNVLMLSCFLRQTLDEQIYQTFWWRVIENAVRVVRNELKRTDDETLENDPEYQAAKAFVTHARWCGGFYFEHRMPSPVLGNDPKLVANEAVNMCKYYFHDTLYTTAKKRYVGALLDADFMQKKEQQDMARAFFDRVHRLQNIPMARMFKEYMADSESDAPLLIDVMLKYCECDMDKLRRRTVEGDKSDTLKAPMERVPFAREHDLQQLQTSEQYVRQVLGF